MQDILSRTSTKPSALRPADASDSRDRLAVVLLGANLWVVGVLWPMLSAPPTGAAQLGLAFLCPLPLAAGLAFRSLRAAALLRAGLWFVGYPLLLSAAIAARPEALNQAAYGPVGLLLLWLSLCAYGAAAARAVNTRPTLLPATHAPLGDEEWDAAPKERGGMQRAFIALCFAGATALCVVAPALGGLSTLEQAWGDAALSGGVLTAIVGAALSVTTLAVYLGSGLRSLRTPEPPDGTFRAAWFLFLALLGAVVYFVVQP